MVLFTDQRQFSALYVFVGMWSLHLYNPAFVVGNELEGNSHRRWLVFHQSYDSATISSSSSRTSNSHRNTQQVLLNDETELITTTACSNKRSRSDYNTRMDFTYLYHLEYSSGTTTTILNATDSNTTTTSAQVVNGTAINDYDNTKNEVVSMLLISIERAIATSVATALGQCTSGASYNNSSNNNNNNNNNPTNGNPSEEYPVYAVEATTNTGTNTTPSKHIIVPSSYYINANSSSNSLACPISQWNDTTATMNDNDLNSENGSTSEVSDVDTTRGCVTVRGMTSILFNEEEQYEMFHNTTNDFDSSNVSTLSSASLASLYEMDWTNDIETLIAVTIQDQNYIKQFVVEPSGSQTSNDIQFTQTTYVQSLGTNMIRLPSNSTTSQSDPTDDNDAIETTVNIQAVVIITAILSFTCTVIMLSLLLLYCRCYIAKRQHHPHPNTSNQSHVNTSSKRISPLRRLHQRHDLYSFEPFEDEVYSSNSNHMSTAPQGWTVITSDNRPHHITTTSPIPSTNDFQQQQQQPQQASVARMITTTYSDLTSDSESIMSSLHLDRIDEVDEEMGDFSYEQCLHEEDTVEDDPAKHVFSSNTNYNLSPERDEYGIEVRLQSPSHMDSNPTRLSIHIPYTSSNNIIPTDFTSDWNAFFEDIDSTRVNENTDIDENQNNTFVDQSIEVSIDNELMYTSDGVANNTSIDNPFPVNTISEFSFTFSSDEQSNEGLDDGSTEESDSEHKDGQRRRTSSNRGHFYDADDFQSIEISVAWLDEKGNASDDDKENRCVTPPEEIENRIPTAKTGNVSNVLLSSDRSKSPNVEMIPYLFQESSANESVSMELPQFVTATESTLPISDITDPKKYTLQDSYTETATYTNDEYSSFTASGAYRSMESRKSNSNESKTIVVDSTNSAGASTSNDITANDSYNNNDHHISSDVLLTEWANNVLVKLMSGSPKMLQCDPTITENSDSWQTNDTESP